MTDKKKAGLQTSQDNPNASLNDKPAARVRKPLTKIERILRHLRTHARGLNRFEAEGLGEHCLNTTIATLRREGWLIAGEWEHVPTRFGVDVRVLRYRHIGFRNPREVAEDIEPLMNMGGGRAR